MPPEPVAQPCEVCGVETTRRCSACLEAGISLFFCSKEHQKLVWPAHKTVCGPGKAHPFFVSPLNNDELARTAEQLDLPVYAGHPSLRVRLEEIGGEPAEDVLLKLSSHLDGESEVAHMYLLLHWIRHGILPLNAEAPTAMIERARSQGIGYFDSELASKYVGKTALLVCARVGVIPFHANSPPLVRAGVPWLSLLQHKALIVIRMAHFTYMDVAKCDPRLGEYARQADERLTGWIRSGMGTGDSVFWLLLCSWAGPGAEGLASRLTAI